MSNNLSYPEDFIDKIICGDALEILKKMPANSVDLVFADPPFNVGKAYKDKRDDYRLWCRRWIGLCFRLLKPTGSFYLMTLSKHLEWKMPLMAIHGKFINLITWRNVSASHGKRSFWLEYQPIMLYGKTDEYIFNTYAQVDMDPVERYRKFNRKRWGGYSTEYKGQLKDRWDNIPFVYAGSIKHKEAVLEKGTNKKAHPCQMPVTLAERAILFSTNEGDRVLDPFVGSGSTAIAAIRTDRHYTGIDLEQKFVDLTNERIREERSQLKLDLTGGGE
jgi:site-specific DNA-methyltransferase (adenine-specific)